MFAFSWARFFAGVVAVAAFLVYEPRVPFDANDYWILVYMERMGTLRRLKRMIWGGKLINREPYPSGVAPIDPAVNAFKTRLDDVDVRIYDPIDRKEKGPLFIYLHGGGWAKGSIDQYDLTVYRLSKSLPSFLFVSVDYRLAPEHLYPAGLDDVSSVYKFLVEHAASYLIDVERIVVGGDSAGGNLAAALCLKLRDENARRRADDALPVPKLQVLIYPGLQSADFSTPSYLSSSVMLSREVVTAYLANYLTGSEDGYEGILRRRHVSPEMRRLSKKHLNPTLIPETLKAGYVPADDEDDYDPEFAAKFERAVKDPYISPLLAESVENLPAAYLIACQYDHLRDDAIFYARRLRAAAVPAELRVYRGAWHGIMYKTNLVKMKGGEVISDDLTQYLAENV